MPTKDDFRVNISDLSTEIKQIGMCAMLHTP